MALSLLKFAVGLGLLVGASELLIRAVEHLASRFNKKVFFISLFLLGVGTSAPELIVTLQSHFSHKPDMAIGNIVGSNIFNILIVGSLVLITAGQIQKTVLKSTALLIVTTLICGIFLYDFSFSRWDGLLLLGLFSLFFIETGKHSPRPQTDKKLYPFQLTLLFLALGFPLLFLGSRITIDSAQVLGSSLGLSQRIIGLFLLSVGTSLPELAVALTALIKKSSDMALGGIIGSNAFNTLFIPAIASLFFALPVQVQILKTDAVVMILSELLLLGMLIGFKKIPKIPICILFILSYGLYAYSVLLHRI